MQAKCAASDSHLPEQGKLDDIELAAHCIAMTDYAFHLSSEPIPQHAAVFAEGEGAEVQFLGTVRGLEDDKPISGIDYTVYLPMAEKMLQELCERGSREQGPHRVFIQHRLGFVAANEPSIIIRVKTKHSAQAFELCRWYLKEIKTHVPIWKRAVFV